MKTIKNVFLLLMAIGIFTTGVSAQQKAGTTSMQFLKVMPCARATALGDAYSAVANGAEALFWNPAGLAWMDDQEVSLTYISWIFDAKLYDIGYALSVDGIGNFGIQFQYVDYGDFDEVINTGLSTYSGQTQPYITGRTFKPYDYVIGLSYARKLTDKFSFGLTAKYAYESLYDNTASGAIMGQYGPSSTFSVEPNRGVILFDAGFKYNTGYRTIQVAASAQNFGPDVKYNSDIVDTHYPAPLLFRLGTTADLVGPNSLFWNQTDHRLGFMFDLFLANDADQQEHIGLEYEFYKMVAFRIGYKINYGTESLTFGLGLHQKVGTMNLAVDYSFGKFDNMISDFAGNSHRISVGVGIQ